MRHLPRLLPLPLCIAATFPALAVDRPPLDWGRCPVKPAVPVFDANAARVAADGKGSVHVRRTEPTTVEGDEQAGTIDIPVFNGNVNLSRGDQFLGTDKLTFDREKQTYVAEGNVRYQDGRMRILAQHAQGNQDTDTHTISDIRYQIGTQRGNGTAGRVELAGSTGVLYGATYSTCPPSERDWQIEASRIDVDSDKGMATAHGAKVRLGRVPVLYMPYFRFPIDERRRTGLLFPSISNSGRNGFDYKQPIYFNIAPNLDDTLSPRLMSKRGLLLDNEFRYLNAAGAGGLRTMYMPKDKLRDHYRASATFNAYQNLSTHWQARANLIWLSDPRFFEDFNNSSAGIALYSAMSSLGVYGSGRHWNASLSADRWQLADYTLTHASLPYDRMPRLTYSYERPFGVLVRAGVDAEAVRFTHQSWRNIDPLNGYRPYGPTYRYPGGTRVDVKPWVSVPLEGNWWYVRPTLAWRQTGYRVDGELANLIAQDRVIASEAAAGHYYNRDTVPAALWQPLARTRLNRGLPIFSLDAGVYFDRNMKWGGRDYVQTLEPRLYYLRAPYKDQRAFPVFDTMPMTFSWGQLFRDNRYSGGDRQSDANQLTVAITTRINDAQTGREKLSASLGQIQYFQDNRVYLPYETPVKRGRSAWVADANYAINDQWFVGGSYQYDPSAKRRDLLSMRTRYLWGEDGIVNLAYRYRRGLFEQVDLSFVYPITPSWSVVGRHYLNRATETRGWNSNYGRAAWRPLETFAGVQWDSCCVAVRVLARRFVANRQGELRNGMMLEFELKGLGSAGQNTRRVLRQSILGYVRDDLYLVPPETATGQPTVDPLPTTP